MKMRTLRHSKAQFAYYSTVNLKEGGWVFGSNWYWPWAKKCIKSLRREYVERGLV